VVLRLVRTNREREVNGVRGCHDVAMAAVVRLETALDLDLRGYGGPRQVAVLATHSAVLDDGRRITLLDDRGWGTTGRWEMVSIEEIEDTARTVVGPDEPAEGQTHEEVAAVHWAYLAGVLRRHGSDADVGTLRSLPHDVVLSERLRARLTRS
jgi:hypothetical protein